MAEPLTVDPASYDGLIEHVRQFVSANYPEDRVTLLSVTLASGSVVSVPIAPPRQNRSHSLDFRSIRWYGTEYRLTPTQAAIVRLLWDALERGDPEMAGETLLEESGSTCGRLPPVFQGNPAWGGLITSGSTKGTYQLAVPAESC